MVMNHLNSRAALSDRIRLLESKQAEDLVALRVQLDLSLERLRPSNIISASVRDLVLSSDHADKLIGSVVNIGSRFLVDKFFARRSGSSVSRVLISVGGLLLTEAVSRNSVELRRGGRIILNFVGILSGVISAGKQEGSW
jgi:hypothetical protein